jgi:hypothetical protein
MVTQAAAAPTPASGWIVSARFDLPVFLLSAAVTLVPWIAVDHLGVAPFYVLAAVAICSNGPHLASTWTRVYLDGRERFRRPVAYLVVPALLAAMVLSFILVDGRDTAWLRTILFYWASWHFAAQCWGLLRIYQRKQGVVGTPIAQLEKALLFAGAAWCVLHRIFTGPWTLFGGPVLHPSPPAWLVNGLGALVAAGGLFYFGSLLAAALRTGRLELRRAAMIGSTVGAFAVPFLLIRDGTAAFAAAACWHGFQYLGIVFFFNRNRFAGGVEPRARLVSWVSQPGRAVAYFALMLALAGVAYGGLLVLARFTRGTRWDEGTWGLFVWTSLTFGHYWLDGVIWKLRKDPELRQRLQAA